MSGNHNLENLDDMLFRINIPTGKPRLGSLLVAEPFLREEYFNHAVIAMIDYGEDRPVAGLVLNKPSGYTLGEAVDGVDEEIDIPIYVGGPLSTERLFFIHTLGDEIRGALPIGNGLFVGGDFSQVKQYINMGFETEGKIRFFAGYSGWDARQLDGEIENHVWAVLPHLATDEILREDAASCWHHYVRELGPAYRNWLYHPAHPQFN